MKLNRRQPNSTLRKQLIFPPPREAQINAASAELNAAQSAIFSLPREAQINAASAATQQASAELNAAPAANFSTAARSAN